VSAAWIWQRIKRVGRSRKSLFEERLGYIEGGSETLMNALAVEIEKGGGRIHYKQRATRIHVEGGAVTAVESATGQRLAADHVICTVPTPYVADLLPDDYIELKAAYRRIANVAVVCVIEFSNLRPLDNTIVYVPYYMPQTHPKFAAPDQAFIEESWACLKTVNPNLTDADRISARVGRLKFAQPVFEPRFREILPPVKTPIRRLQIADTAFYYPEDRGVSESFRMAKQMVESLEAS
jgi:protoporphyrinogen oxidase